MSATVLQGINIPMKSPSPEILKLTIISKSVNKCLSSTLSTYFHYVKVHNKIRFYLHVCIYTPFVTICTLDLTSPGIVPYKGRQCTAAQLFNYIHITPVLRRTIFDFCFKLKYIQYIIVYSVP